LEALYQISKNDMRLVASVGKFDTSNPAFQQRLDNLTGNGNITVKEFRDEPGFNDRMEHAQTTTFSHYRHLCFWEFKG
jgi:hypothetical protein